MALLPMPASVRAFTGGDTGDAQALVSALTALRDAERDPARRAALDAVLSGKSTMHELLRTTEGRGLLAEGARTFTTRWDSVSEEEREELAQQGREQENHWREEIAALPEPMRHRVLPDR